MRITSTCLLLFALSLNCFAQGPQNDLQQLIRIQADARAPRIALTHVRIVDGTGAPALEDQIILIEGGQNKNIGPTSSTKIPEETQILDLKGYTVLPGLVGMHDHMFFPM